MEEKEISETKINDKEKITRREADERAGWILAEKIIGDIREILTKTSNETKAIALILKYVEKNGLKYAGMRLNKTGSATFKVKTADHSKHTVNLTTKFHS